MKKTSFNKNIFLIIILAISIIFLAVSLDFSIASASDTLPSGSSQANQSFTQEAEEESNIILIIEIVIGLLLISSLVGIITERLRVPYTAGLVVIGLILALIGRTDITVSPELFLGLLVPPLIFEAAFQVKAQDLLKDMAPILSLAIPGVLLTTFLVGGVLYWGTDFSLTTALLFGSLIAATDPVAVVSLFRSLGVPHRLQLLLEGESLFNDGTAIVLFNMMLTIAITGYFNLGESILNFIVVSGGGLLIGLLLGLVISLAISIIDNSLIETTLTTVLAFGSYILAEQFHVSGVLAVVAAGIVSGNLGPQRMTPTTRILVYNFWEYAAFLANSFVFLLIGLQIDLNILITDWKAVLWAILAVLVARAASIYGLSWIGPGIPRRYKHVLYWGGLRGAISLALALSLPVSLGEQGTIIKSMAFGVVLFTLLVQGLTMKPFITRMGLIEKSPAQEEYESLNARSVMARSAHKQLESMYKDGMLSSHVWNVLSKPITTHANSLSDTAAKTMRAHPDVETKELESAIKAVLTSERATLRTLLRDGRISEETFTSLVHEVDSALTEQQSDLVRLLMTRTTKNIEILMTIVIQDKDLQKISNLLEPYGFPMTHIASTGGFLGRKNATVLIGLPKGKRLVIKKLLESANLANLKAGAEDTKISPELSHDGATIFSLPIERYEEL
ncbi:MAG: Na+/H+ antiporter [Chloroflexota bacterium]|nr:MAG: Na+/H+ antiporter [Chloroflexota bacterium]HDD62127.1 Na+/H+ antiporter [Chloroflexota bacterium]